MTRRFGHKPLWFNNLSKRHPTVNQSNQQKSMQIPEYSVAESDGDQTVEMKQDVSIDGAHENEDRGEKKKAQVWVNGN